MSMPNNSLAQRAATAATAFQKQQSGNNPRAVTAVIDGKTLIVTLQGTLSPAELVLAKTPAGAAQLREFHRHLFASSAALLCTEIKRITGVQVGEATVEVEPVSGTMVQVFQLAAEIPPEVWKGDGPAAPPAKKYTAPYMT